MAWLLAPGGVALLVIATLTQSDLFRPLLALLGVAVLDTGLAAAAGYQVVARSDRAAERYRGPAPLLVFGLFLASSLVLSTLLLLFGLNLDGSDPLGFLLGLLVEAGCYAAVVWLFVVRTGALTWSAMGWPSRQRVARMLETVGTSIIVTVPATFGVLVLGTVVSRLLGGVSPPDVLPTATDPLSALAVVASALVVAPIGEELFFRGFAVTAWLRDLGPRAALWRSALFFALVHILNVKSATFAEGVSQAILVVAEILPLGLLLGWLFLRRGIVASITSHITYNGLLLVLVLMVGNTSH